MILPALLVAAAMADCTPLRWTSDPASLDLVGGTPFNCIVLEPSQSSAQIIAEARRRGIEVVALGSRPAVSVPAVEVATRSSVLRTAANKQVVAISEGVWPGINPEEIEGAALAGPTSAPWLDTNSGVLRYLRSRTRARLWMANRPPEGNAYPVIRYLQAMADAALGGGRWIVSLDADFERRLARREKKAVEDWKQICSFAGFLQDHGAWRDWRTYSQLGIAEDPAQGALVSGSVLDMMAVQHLPVKTVSGNADNDVRVLVNLTGRRVDAPVLVVPKPGWKFPLTSPDQIAIRKADLPSLDELWKQVQEATGRQNFGIRLFNGSGMLSRPAISPDGKHLTIAIVNYTGYPVEGVTLHVAGQWKKARLLEPGRDARDLVLYGIKDGQGMEIASIGVMALIEVE